MDHDIAADTAGLEAFLARQERVGLLRFLTCGSVDDGKSTLIGRLLYDTKLILDDHLTSLERDSRRHGSTGADIDFALLVDGLEAEREQNITIDVAYRFFATDRRRFIVADTPGHEQYTRNMATGASNADLAVVLVDATKGVLTQTRRHAFIASLLGIRHLVLAVNKIDLVTFSAARFQQITDDFTQSVAELGFAGIVAIPLSARYGDNVIAASPDTPWYQGPSLLEHLESVDVEGSAMPRPFRLPVQWVNRPNASFRGYAGTVASGAIRAGASVRVAQSGRETRISRIVTMDGDLPEARAGDAVTLVLEDQVDASRGDVLTDAAAIPVTDRFDANLVWLASHDMFIGRSYLLKLGTRTVPATITRIHHRIDINTYRHEPAETLRMNEVAGVSISAEAVLALEPYAASRDLGGFILIDRLSNATVGVGMVTAVGQAATDVIWHHMQVDRTARAAQKGQKPVAVWLTGLSGTGKSTIADLVERRLHKLGHHTFTLDGDNLRHGLNRDLGFSEADRVENIRRAAESARLMTEAGLIVLASFISPYRADREAARERFAPGEFIEVFVDTPVDECRRRDPKGLYRRADAGEIRNFTGVDAPYEVPLAPDLHLHTEGTSAEALAEQIVDELRARGILGTS
jgi:bifunctional enzyme CysN/CysC